MEQRNAFAAIGDYTQLQNLANGVTAVFLVVAMTILYLDTRKRIGSGTIVWSPLAWRGGSGIMAIVAGATVFLANDGAYYWWFSSYGLAMLVVVAGTLPYLRNAPPTYRKTVAVFAVAALVLALALGLGWAVYMRWLGLPAVAFDLLCVAACLEWTYAAVRPIRME